MAEYTERARSVIFFAHYEASPDAPRSVEPEHLLLALLRVDPKLFQILSPDKVDVAEDIRTKITSRSSDSKVSWTSKELSTMSFISEEIINRAAEETQNLNLSYIDSEHILLSLLKQGLLRINQILSQYGINTQQVEEQIRGDSIRKRNYEDDGYHLIAIRDIDQP